LHTERKYTESNERIEILNRKFVVQLIKEFTPEFVYLIEKKTVAELLKKSNIKREFKMKGDPILTGFVPPAPRRSRPDTSGGLADCLIKM